MKTFETKKSSVIRTQRISKLKSRLFDKLVKSFNLFHKVPADDVMIDTTASLRLAQNSAGLELMSQQAHGKISTFKYIWATPCRSLSVPSYPKNTVAKTFAKLCPMADFKRIRSPCRWWTVYNKYRRGFSVFWMSFDPDESSHEFGLGEKYCYLHATLWPYR